MSSYNEQELGLDPVTITVIGYGVTYASKFISSLIIARQNAKAQLAQAKEKALQQEIIARIEKLDIQIKEIEAWIEQERKRQSGIKMSTSLAAAGAAALGLFLISQ